MTKKQILIIGGGTTFSSYEKYIDNLKTTKINLERLKYRPEWKSTIATDLGDNYDVFVPKMPNTANANYNEWKIWFEKIILLLDDGIILIGHSMGGIFLAKYLSENNLKGVKVKTVIFVAAPYMDTGLEEMVSFSLPMNLSRFSNQVGKIVLIQSDDDPTVPAIHAQMYRQKLPNSELIMFGSHGHFKQDHFPELVDILKDL